MNNWDLNSLFPDIQRSSEAHDEGKYYDLLRLSPAVTVISGAQSGVDSAGLRAASFLGLPAFGIMPRGGRREGETIEQYAGQEHVYLRKIELATDSYRFRTYANVYFADVTVILDFVNGSEGTECTVRACEWFGRPCLLLSDLSEENAAAAVAFLLRHRPGVINIAGNSRSKITEQVENDACGFLIRVLRKYAFLRVTPTLPLLGACREKSAPISVAIPNFSVCKEIFRDFLWRAYRAQIPDSKNLVFREEGFTLVLARPREIIRLVQSGVDMGFVGEDLCEEYAFPGDVLLRTGLIPNATVLVVNPDKADRIESVCSQYPVAAERLLHRAVNPITGSAEAYLKMGIFDACVDSYQTGDTAWQNGLDVQAKLAESSLVTIGSPAAKSSRFFRDFVRYLQGEL